MMSTVATQHRNENGEQVTERIVTLTDATGEESEHTFLATDDGHEYRGDGDPSDAALEALEDAGFNGGT